MLHDQCKEVFANVATLLRDINQDQSIDSNLRERAKIVGTQVLFAGHRILDMEKDTLIASRDCYKEG